MVVIGKINKKILFRVILFLLVLLPVVRIEDFYQHFYLFLTGSMLGNVITNHWGIAAVNILLFTAFLIPLTFRRKADWSEYGLVGGFFVSLFVEMYGIPLTILLVAKYFFSPSQASSPGNIVEFNFLGAFGMNLAMVYGAIFLVIGSLLIIVGWITLYRNVDTGASPVMTGIYSYSRHPQYLGFILVIFGWFISWPSFISVIFVPILIYKYAKLCRIEEADIPSSTEYEEYRRKVPLLI